MEILSLQFLMALGSIVILDLVLAGDNAVVIAMASRELPEVIRKKAIYIGTGGDSAGRGSRRAASRRSSSAMRRVRSSV
ncbi:MAG: TerC family protein, partial [Selenomonadaceae bacterium]